MTAETEADADAEDEPPTEEEFFGGMVARFADRASEEDGATFLAALDRRRALPPPRRTRGLGRRTATRSRSCHACTPRPTGPRSSAARSWNACFVIDHETDDGHNIGLVARHPDAAEPHLVMVLVDVNNGDMAKDVLISDQLDDILDEALSIDGLTMVDLDPPLARARIEAAFTRTDMTLDAPVSEDFDEARPMVEQLLDHHAAGRRARGARAARLATSSTRSSSRCSTHPRRRRAS